MNEILNNKYFRYSLVLFFGLANLWLMIMVLPMILNNPFWSGFISILSVFSVGFFLAYIFNFAVVNIQNRVKNRNFAILLFLTLILSVLLITAILIIPRIADTIPILYNKFIELVNWFTDLEIVKQNNIKISVSDLGLSNPQVIIQTIWSSLSTFFGIFVVMILFLFEFPQIQVGIERLLPKHFQERYGKSFSELDRRMGRFTGDYGSLLLVLFVEHLILTLLLGLNPLIAVSVVIFYLIPVVGGFIYLSSVFLLAFSQEGSHILFIIPIDSPVTYALIVIAILTVVFIWDSMFLMPKYIGDALKLSFIVVIFVTFMMSLLNWIGFMLSPFVLVLLKFMFDEYMREKPRFYDHEKENAIEHLEHLKKHPKHDKI
ncbi:MAG: AI-2E family transporter [Culicoidibacterales bacterium]